MFREATSPCVFDRRSFLAAGGAALAGGVMLQAAKPLASASSSLEEATLDQLQAGLASGRWTSQGMVSKYLARIRSLDQSGPMLRSVLEINPDALALAAALDVERRKTRTTSTRRIA